MITTHTKDIEILTDKGTITLTFSPSIPRGYGSLADAFYSYDRDCKIAIEVAAKDKKAGALLKIETDYYSALNFRNAIRTALPDSEWEKIKDIIEEIDIKAVIEIASSIMTAYNEHYSEMLTEGMEK